MKIVKSCEIRFRPEGIYLFNYLNTDYGLFANVPFVKMGIDSDATLVGKQVMKLLNAIPDKPVNISLGIWRKSYADHLALLGFKTEKAFSKGSLSLSARLEEAQVVVVPYGLKPGEGFIPIEEKKAGSLPQPEAVGKLILDCRKECF